MSSYGTALVLGLLVCFGTLPQVAVAWPVVPQLPPLPGGVDSSSYIPNITLPSWQPQLQQLWAAHKHRISYCVGESMDDAVELLKGSFPVPLITDPAGDAICSNATSIYSHLCGPSEISWYLKFLLLTDNPEKIPSNLYCDFGNDEAEPCAPGFFQTLAPDFSNPLAPSIVKPHPCCAGYFCPSMLTCMMPCPLGAYCPRAWPADPPDSYNDADLGLKPLLGKTDKWCAPYSYKMRAKLGCGGADKWSIRPSGAFPLVAWNPGSGSIYCDGGKYCPDPQTRLPCKPGHFCKQGSSQVAACPALAGCSEGTETPTDSWIGFVVDGCLFLLLGFMWQVSQVYNKLMQRLSKRERIRIMWNKIQPQVTVVEVAEEQQPSWPITFPVPPADAGNDSGAVPAVLPPRLFMRDPARRRSQGAGSASAPVWASFDGQNVPLLEYEMQQECAGGGSTDGHIRLSRNPSGIVLAANTTLILEPMASTQPKRGLGSIGTPRPAGAAAGALLRQSSDEELDPVGHYSSFPSRDASVTSEAGGLVGGADVGVMGITGRYKPLLDVGFEGLSMRLRSCGKQVLQGVSGELKHGRLSAIMGPAGAGKTTLMNALAGKASYGIVSGMITINGRPDRLERHKRLMGFVPQDDVMYRNLTVEENLMYSACFRLPASTSHAQRLEVVERSITDLGLGDVRYSLIGNEEVRGISGGERKRVNVGLELVADPSLLFLDEPTSGLDSTASKLVVQGLERVAHSGVTVAAVIHQPSYETFSMFDDLVLLAKGGLTAYFGHVKDVQSYFEGLGFAIPKHMNPADAYLDIISGTILPTSGAALDIAASWRAQQQLQQQQQLGDSFPPSGRGAGGLELLLRADREGSASSRGGSLSGAVPKHVEVDQVGLQPIAMLANLYRAVFLWLAVTTAVVSAALQDTVSAARNTTEQLLTLAGVLAARCRSNSGSGSGGRRVSRSSSDGRPALLDSSNRSGSSSSRRSPPGLWRQFYWCFTRAVLMRTREPMIVFTEYMIFAITGSFLGLMSDRGRGSTKSYSALRVKKETDELNVGNIVHNIVALGLMATVSGIKTFGGPERLVYFREASSGLNKLAYFWALDTWGHAGLLLRCGVYLTMYYSFSQPRAVVWQMYIITCAIYYACTGMAYVFSQVMGPDAAQLTAAVAALINALVASKFATSGVMGWLNTISYARWGLEGYVIAEANCLTGVWLLARCADLKAFSSDVTRFWYAMKILVYIGFGSRLAACLGLLVLNRDKTL